MSDLTDVIHAHQYKGTINYGDRPWRDVGPLEVVCSCGHTEPTEHRQGRRTHSAHVAAVIRLRLSDKAAVYDIELADLPEGAIVRSPYGSVYQQCGDDQWEGMGIEEIVWTDDLKDEFDQPGTILFLPGEDGEQ